MITEGLFKTFWYCIWEIFYWGFEGITKNAQTLSTFELENTFILEFCRKSIGTYVHSASKIDKEPYDLKCHMGKMADF